MLNDKSSKEFEHRSGVIGSEWRKNRGHNSLPGELMKVPIGYIINVQPHPKNDELRSKCDLVTVMTYPGKRWTNVSTRPAPEQPRYAQNQYVVVLQENLILPEWILRRLDLWDTDKGKGVLSGKQGNRTKGRRIGEVMSEIAMLPLNFDPWQNSATRCFSKSPTELIVSSSMATIWLISLASQRMRLPMAEYHETKQIPYPPHPDQTGCGNRPCDAPSRTGRHCASDVASLVGYVFEKCWSSVMGYPFVLAYEGDQFSLPE